MSSLYRARFEVNRAQIYSSSESYSLSLRARLGGSSSTSISSTVTDRPLLTVLDKRPIYSSSISLRQYRAPSNIELGHQSTSIVVDVPFFSGGEDRPSLIELGFYFFYLFFFLRKTIIRNEWKIKFLSLIICVLFLFVLFFSSLLMHFLYNVQYIPAGPPLII